MKKNSVPNKTKKPIKKRSTKTITPPKTLSPEKQAIIDNNASQALKKIKPSANKNIPLEDILAYKDKGLSNTDIAELLKCSPANITKRLQYCGYDRDIAKDFRDNKSAILQHKQALLLSCVNEASIKDNLSIRDAIVSFGILHDKETGKNNDIQTSGITININLDRYKDPDFIDITPEK